MLTYLQTATNEQWRNICAEVGITEESLENDVKYLKIWMEKQPNLPHITDDEILINFLVWTKNSMERTKKYLQMFYATRIFLSDVYLSRDPASKEMENFFKMGCNFPLPKLTPEGSRIYICKTYENVKHIQLKAETFLELGTMLVDYTIKNDRNKSIIYIYDFKDLKMVFATQLFSIMKRYLICGMKSLPVRIQKVYILNLNPLIEKIVNSGKSLVKKKIADRVEIWTKKPQDLIEVLPKHVLPSDYGGDEPSLEELSALFHESLKEFNSWMEKENKITADLCQKLNNYPMNNDLYGEYGVEGSFRKICID